MAWYNPSDPVQRNWALGGLALLVVMVPFNMYFLTPRNEENDVVRDRLESLEIQNRQATSIIARGGVDELRRRME